MIAAISLALAVASAPAADKWEIKPNFESKAAWSITVNVDMPSEKHEATFTMRRKVEKAKEGKPSPATFTWEDLTVDGNAVSEVKTWELGLDATGAIVSGDSSEGNVIRTMLAPFVFSCPTKPVEAGDKWTVENKPTGGKDAEKITYEYTVQAVDKVHGVEVLRIAAKIAENAKGGLQCTGTWWVSKDGRVLKFEADLKDWVVPMAANGDPMDAHILAEAK